MKRKIFGYLLSAIGFCFLIGCSTRSASNSDNQVATTNGAIQFAPGNYCCYKAQKAGANCQHRCCVEARLHGMYCALCVQAGRATVHTQSGGAAITNAVLPAQAYQRVSQPTVLTPTAPSGGISGQLPGGTDRLPMQSSYSGVGQKHWIRENIDRGSFILLEDGSLWEITRLDRFNAGHWHRNSNIFVVGNDYGFGGFDHTLINTDDREKVTAKLVSHK